MLAVVAYKGSALSMLFTKVEVQVVNLTLSTVGVFTILSWLAYIGRMYWYYYLHQATIFEAFLGDWAIVTGASRGLGRAYAISLARRGLNVVLIARTRSTLLAVAKECEQYDVKTHVIVADFSEHVEHVCSAVWQQLCKQEGNDCIAQHIAVLVNNVGGLPPRNLCQAPNPSYCEDLDHVTYNTYFQFNVLPTIQMTSHILGGMVQRDRGCIINISSINALQACPYISHYSAAKAYIQSYSACLRTELRGRGSKVQVEVVCPGPVATDGIRRSGMPSAGVPDPICFAEQSLSLVGTPFAKVPWLQHWWSMQLYGPDSFIRSQDVAEAKLYEAMDFSKVLSPRTFKVC
eukprot:gnl/MRDRNA2_/MRDRNA2_33597_c0_seq1.p1 gnl/MRDRNA2_/MRDRNA2_33597_c0~~gnl/MRDRNA2_/MRDRNA2_33597_c0_seq1.p1  ORF type:complete len:389 (+),score=45.72 gnl/MRDRNA2_/MRDRNA2_33597_c0_seq1:128-1168(+)